MGKTKLQLPNPPRKPLMPYMKFSKECWETIKSNKIEMKFGQIAKMNSQKWRDMAAEEKQKYIDQYEREKAEYNSAMAIYKQSPAYQSYLAAKRQLKLEEIRSKEEAMQLSFQEQLNAPYTYWLRAPTTFEGTLK